MDRRSGARSGIGLLFIVVLAPVVGTLLLAAPFYLFRSKTRWWVALILGFVLFNVVVGGLFGLWAYINFDWVAGLLWFLGKTFGLVFLFVWMRGTLPRVRIDQLMGFAWKWLLPASLLNLFVTAAAIVVIDALGRPGADEPLHGLVPGFGIVKGMALTLRRFFEPKATVMYPEMPPDVADALPRPPPAPVRRVRRLKCETCFQCAQACPIECIDMGGMDTKGRFHVHWGPPETYGERREESALRRSGRTVPDQAYEHFAPFDLTTIDEILEAHDHDPKDMLQILEATQAAFGYLPVAAIKRISEANGRLVRDDLRDGDVLRPPPLRASDGGRGGRVGVAARRPTDDGYMAGPRRLARRSWPRLREEGPRPVTAILAAPRTGPPILLARARAKDPTTSTRPRRPAPSRGCGGRSGSSVPTARSPRSRRAACAAAAAPVT